jgi:hypothetical protein
METGGASGSVRAASGRVAAEEVSEAHAASR